MNNENHQSAGFSTKQVKRNFEILLNFVNVNDVTLIYFNVYVL